MEKAEIQALIREAFEGQKFAYVPYSRFHVGAALRARDGRVFKGCNIENAGYTPTNCAERTALFKAVSEGVREFDAIAIVGSKVGEKNTLVTGPCGVCRQALYLCKGVCCHCNNGDGGFLLIFHPAYPGCSIISIHHRHLNVHKNHIIISGNCFLQLIQTLCSILRTIYNDLFFRKQFYRNLCIQIIILCKKNTFSFQLF